MSDGVGGGAGEGGGAGVGVGDGEGEGDAGSAYASDGEIRERDGNRCARDGSARGPLDVHHRWMRSAGADERACNRVTLCRSCHDFVHRNRVYAREHGWIVSRSGDPATVPVDHVLWPAGPVLLLNEHCGIGIWQG